MGYIGTGATSFFPLMEATILEKIAKTDNIGGQVIDFMKDFYTVRINEKNQYSRVDPNTGEVKKAIPKYFIRTDKAVNQLSTDLNKVGSIWIKSLLDYSTSRNIEDTLLTLINVEKGKGNLIVVNGQVVFENDVPKVSEGISKNTEYLQVIVDDALYGIRENLNSMGNVSIGAFSGKTTSTDEEREQRAFSIKKGLRSADGLVRILGIGLKPLIGLASALGVNLQAYINAGSMYNYKEFTSNEARAFGNAYNLKEKALLHLIIPLNERVVGEKRRDIARKQSMTDWLNTWSFTDAMLATISWPERQLQYSNAVSMLNNSMVVEGKIVNIRQFLRKQDRKTKYGKNVSVQERKVLEKSFEARVKELQKSNLQSIVQISENDITVPGVNAQELAKFKTSIIEFGRVITGMMNENNKPGYTRDSIFNSFMMFRSWVPKQVSIRVGGIHKNMELDTWEYGKTRIFVKTLTTLGFRNITKLNDIIKGTPEGLAILAEMLETKKEEYWKKEGKVLNITEEEFYDLTRQEIANQFKELGVLVGMISMVITAKAMQPPEDATTLEKNQYRWFAKLINRTSDEISFYYNPVSMDAITKGSIMPSISLLIKMTQFFEHTSRATTGYILDDEKQFKEAHPGKYFLNLVPGAYQIQSEVLPYFWPEEAKEWGIQITSDARRR